MNQCQCYFNKTCVLALAKDSVNFEQIRLIVFLQSIWRTYSDTWQRYVSVRVSQVRRDLARMRTFTIDLSLMLNVIHLSHVLEVCNIVIYSSINYLNT